MKISQFFSYIPFQKTIAAVLVMMILVSQTIHVDFFDSVLAGPENYRDIVSIVVDRDTYAAERSRVLRYAGDIAGYLGGVRTSILVVAKDTPVATIATKNEKLYYEGDSEKGVSSLVGTILIGNIPIPIVEKDGANFSSLYPYVDFADKSFVYDPSSTRYIYQKNSGLTEAVDIWHGVINPAVGRSWSGALDIRQIGQFLDKTHEFYTKSGKFAPSNIPPKVFYYDGFSESKSINARSLFQYTLTMKNAENIAYSRFTKYLLRDVTKALTTFDKTNEDPDIASTFASLGLPTGGDTLAEDQISKLPDIQSRDVILGFLKNFKGIFNEKSLGDELLSVHNAGRYTSGSTVKADLLPISISVMDEIARSTLREANNAIEKQIDTLLIDQKYARRIPILDEISLGSGTTDRNSLHMSILQNYMFGKKSTEINDPLQCTIARGSTGTITEFGRSQLVEANVAFDISKTESQIETLKKDTELLIGLKKPNCFPNSKPRIDSYWGGNSILRIATATGDLSAILDTFPTPTQFSGFTAPIYSLGGMKESNRLPIGGVNDCLPGGLQYLLSPARLMTYTEDVLSGYGESAVVIRQNCTTAYPSEWTTGVPGGCSRPSVFLGAESAPRYTCISDVVASTAIPSFSTYVTEYGTSVIGGCINGALTLDGKSIMNKSNTCITTSGPADDLITIDETQYKNVIFHTIPSLYHHNSPTDEEILAAKSNTVTPSLPIDIERYVEFFTPKGNIARIHYPNFFDIRASDISSARNWIRDQGDREWQAIIDREQVTTMSLEETKVAEFLSPGVLPTVPIDWNIYISDEMITKILQSRNWLQPDISVKYRQAIESMLSYSNGSGSTTSPTTLPPQIPVLGNEYEIAYLGLPSSFDADFSQGSSSSAIINQYDTRLREIEGANISDELVRDGLIESNNPATECGPPDGVPLLQWPSAIMCWIKAQFPPRILAGSCGPSTIGLDPPRTSPLVSPGDSLATDTGALTVFYAGSRLIPHLPRSSMQLSDSITVDFTLQKADTILGSLPGTTAYLEIISGTSGGKKIEKSDLQNYLDISPSNLTVGEKGANFVLISRSIAANLSLRAYYILPLAGGGEIRIDSTPFQIQITPEYYSLRLEQSGSVIGNVDVTSPDPIGLSILPVFPDGSSIILPPTISIQILDDIDRTLLYSRSDVDPNLVTLPTDVTKKVGVYRVLIRDSRGVSGELTFGVISGSLSQIRVTPVSSALVRGTSTLAMIRLLDRLSNPTSPDLHTLRLDISGGYLVDANGDKKTSMSMDIMESQIPVILGSDTVGTLRITATVNETITNTTELTIYDTARIILMRDRDPRVGDEPIGARIEIQDAAGVRMAGLSSVVSWGLPDGAGIFSKKSIRITDGISEPFDYIPGTIAGNHALMLDVVGIGSLTNIVFSLLPGDPLYTNHSIVDNTIVFALRDRYGNMTQSNFSATISRNVGPLQTINFVNGEYTLPLHGGYYEVSVPKLKDYNISYKDSSGTYTVGGIDKYIAYIKGNDEKINFAPDYNARYTVLAGGSFLREGEDILYGTAPGLSQSLAVSTILDSPYRYDTFLSIFPGGTYTIGNTPDIAIQTSISLDNNIPLLTVSDITTHKQIARILYPMKSARLETCRQTLTNVCSQPSTSPTIRLSIPTGSPLNTKSNTDSIILQSNSLDILSIYTSGSIYMNPDITLIPRDNSNIGLEMAVMQGGKEVATITYMMDKTLSVVTTSEINPTTPNNTPIILNSGYSISIIHNSSLSSNILGYKIWRPNNTLEIDENKNGPNHTNSLGILSELPGVGWGNNNTMLLAYAGGDTVGESTRFFHTYGLINLGDPVAHIDHGRPGTEIDGIDRTVGSIVARSSEKGISDFFHRDMDADGIEDLLIVYADGYIELFLNRGGKFRSRGMIIYNRDIDSKKISFADFTHDGYSDIVGINSTGGLILIDNTNRRFSRRDILLEGGAVVPNHISQFHIYDMDSDGRDDITYITSGGELGILYGTMTPGTFIKKILDPTLGISLSTTPILIGGAIKSDQTPVINGSLSVTPTSSTTIDDTLLRAEVYYQYTQPNTTPSVMSIDAVTLSGVYSDVGSNTISSKIDTYVRSQYASAYGLEIEKKYANLTHTTLYPNDRINTIIRIHNTSNKTMKNVEYLDTIPKIFSLESTRKYTIKKGGTSVSRDFENIGDNEYDAHFVVGDIAPGAIVEIGYELIALSASYGDMIVGDLERGTTGADIYGDVGFRTSTTCGAELLLWTSGPDAREYTRGTHNFGSISLPDGIASRLTDADNNKIPDSIETMSRVDRLKAYADMSATNGPQAQSIIKTTKTGNQLNIGFDESSVASIEDVIQNLANGLSCGFGGGSCMSFPINWAPLAPGSSPTLFGLPLAPNLMTPSAGLPVFSAMTGIPVYGTWGCFPIPSTFPPSPIGLSNTCLGNLSSAGGILGTWDPTNFLRIFVTPTLTLGMGTAICMGGPAMAMGMVPPPGLSPLIQGGNCIVMVKPMNVCKGDGSSSDGDVSAVSGLGTISDTWNASSCQIKANILSESDDRNLTKSIVSYLKSPNAKELTTIYTGISKRGARSISIGPRLAIGSSSSGGSEISVEVDSNTQISDISSVIKLKNKRIAAFPDFIMDWLTRQTEELTTSLFTPPNLTIIPPTSLGQNAQLDSSFDDFAKKLGSAYSSANYENIKQGIGKPVGTKTSTAPGIPDSLKGIASNSKGTLNTLKTAYTEIGKLPFISIKQVNIPLNIPWFDKRELDRYARSLDGYLRDLESASRNLCISDPSAACLDRKAKLQSGGFITSIRENLKRIEEYKRFPMKIQKYITWKERYIVQILCNINSIQQITGGWLRDNGVRFRKWAELFVLIKAIADGWQPLLDIFADTSATCSVCRNERNNLQYWKFKLLSMLIPSIPVLKFPKWPDIVLDLSDIRLGINISMPNFIPRISPIRLPNLPNLSIGSIGASLDLPAIPILPALPPLPDLPDLPSLPRIKLPDLPPPPKIPKIAGSITAFLSIMKLISKMYCYYQKTVLIPEWQVGDVIAQRTERQGTLPFDFINLDMPQFSLPSIKEIRVASHVNYELRSDFISEFARSIVKPINSFQTDIQGIIPKKIGTDIIVPSVKVNIKPRTYLQDMKIQSLPQSVTTMIDIMNREKDIFLDTDHFASYLIEQFQQPELVHNNISLRRELATARIESDALENDITTFNNERFTLMREYLSAESDTNAELQNIVDLFSQEMLGEPRQLIADISSSSARSTGLLAELDTYQSGAPTPKIEMKQEKRLAESTLSLHGKLSRMVAATTVGGSPSDPGDTISAGYSANYQGIYIRTPSGLQTRLFDYIAPINSTTRVDSVDIDKDGDMDYLYLLDGVLYVKYSWMQNPNKIIDNSVKISEVPRDDTVQYVPNYFHENVSTPKSLNYSFVPASSTETEWRVEFYDRYAEWDHIDIGDHDPMSTPKTTIDMLLQTPTTTDPTYPGLVAHPITRSLSSVADRDSFILEGRSIDVYTGALSISLSPGRVLYTGNRRVTITYTNQSTPIPRSISLDPQTGYEFSEITEIMTTGGRLYLIGAEDSSRYTYSDDLIGVPILPGMRLYASDAGAILRNHTSDRDIALIGGATYLTYDLGERAIQYQVSLPYQNSYYYARLHNLTDTQTDRAGVILLSPQTTSDDGAPIIDLPSRIRLPIYSKKSYKISDILTDLSAASITIDSDLTTDTNGNGIFDDDFTTIGDGFVISNSDISFGSFNTPGKYNMVLRAVDEVGNTTIMPLSVDTYALIPQIQSVTNSGVILGNLSESLSGTPVHFFRVRPGEGPTLLTPTATSSDPTGGFSTPSFFTSPEIITMRTSTDSGIVDIHGIFALPSGYRTEISPANDAAPMQIYTMSPSGSISHIHTLSLPEDIRFIDRSLSTTTATGVIISPLALVTRVVPASSTDISIPGGVYITDSTYHPVSAIARDGNIYTIDKTITLQYRVQDGYMTIDIIRQGAVIASIEYHIDFFYTMR
ncbi:VCBS repeat-containing protein [Candidatus Gracilibacteria bacterium]|nr:VCBS repeat-containing protein [Candidatus Gracilibacteria bacterium]